MTRRGRKNRLISSALRAWIASFFVLVMVVSGFVHAAAHAAPPGASNSLEIAAGSDCASDDGLLQADLDASHCPACAATSMLAVATAGAPALIYGEAETPTCARAVQRRPHADPPPPKA